MVTHNPGLAAAYATRTIGITDGRITSDTAGLRGERGAGAVMNGSAVRRAVRGGLKRRRVQTLVIGLVLLASTAASVLALGLIADSRGPFDHAFAAQNGAHAVIVTSPARATAAQLTTTRSLPGVTAAAGPFTEVTIAPSQGGLPFGPLTVVGRANPGGPVDDLVLQSGHWPTGPGQIVLASDPAPGEGVMMSLGSTLSVTGKAGGTQLTVVGLANSVTSTAGGWVVPAEMRRLVSASLPASEQMLYRFASAGTAAQVSADVNGVAAALPRGAVEGAQSYLSVKADETGNIGPFVSVPRRLRGYRAGDVSADRRERRQRRGRRRLPPDRGTQEHRLHSRPGGRRLHGPGVRARGGRLPDRRGPRQPAGHTAPAQDRGGLSAPVACWCRSGSTSRCRSGCWC